MEGTVEDVGRLGGNNELHPFLCSRGMEASEKQDMSESDGNENNRRGRGMAGLGNSRAALPRRAVACP